MTTPLSGMTFHQQVGLAMVSLCTKFEVSMCTRYEAMSGGANCRKWGYGILKVMGNVSIR